MKRTILLCVLSGLLAAWVTHLIHRSKDKREEKKEQEARAKQHFEDSCIIADNLNPGSPLFKSDSIDLTTASYMTKDFRNQSAYLIPQAWTFEKRHIDSILNNPAWPNINKLKLYAAVKDVGGVYMMTMIAVPNNYNDSDVTVSAYGNTMLYEYADPCPPKCGTSHVKLIGDKEPCALRKMRFDDIHELPCDIFKK